MSGKNACTASSSANHASSGAVHAQPAVNNAVPARTCEAPSPALAALPMGTVLCPFSRPWSTFAQINPSVPFGAYRSAFAQINPMCAFPRGVHTLPVQFGASPVPSSVFAQINPTSVPFGAYRPAYAQINPMCAFVGDARFAAGGAHGTTSATTVEKKQCAKCNQFYPLHAFYSTRRGLGVVKHCLVCRTDNNKSKDKCRAKPKRNADAIGSRKTTSASPDKIAADRNTVQRVGNVLATLGIALGAAVVQKFMQACEYKDVANFFKEPLVSSLQALRCTKRCTCCAHARMHLFVFAWCTYTTADDPVGVALPLCCSVLGTP